MPSVTEVNSAELLETLYKKYHKKEFIHPDPLEFVLEYKTPGDMEIAGVIASSFATGRVGSILKAVRMILEPFPDLKNDLLSAAERDLENIFGSFKYRFYNSKSLIGFLTGIKETLLEYGSLEECFYRGFSREKSVQGGLASLASGIRQKGSNARSVLPDPDKGSALKRLNMFLRWMVRRDDIDPGPWENIPPSSLIIPLDTHIMQISRILKFTSRKNADMQTAKEITEALREFDPEDPVRFDFSLSRLGIHPGLSYEELYSLVME